MVGLNVDDRLFVAGPTSIRPQEQLFWWPDARSGPATNNRSWTQPYHNAPAIESRSATLPVPSLDRWWTGFNDPALAKIVERALAQNLDLAASFARVEQARAAAQEAGANRKPSFVFNGSDTSSRQSVATPIGRAVSGVFPGFNRDQNVLDLGIGATWEADIFGSLKRGAEAANAEAQAAEAERLGRVFLSSLKQRMPTCKSVARRYD